MVAFPRARWLSTKAYKQDNSSSWKNLLDIILYLANSTRTAFKIRQSEVQASLVCRLQALRQLSGSTQVTLVRRTEPSCKGPGDRPSFTEEVWGWGVGGFLRNHSSLPRTRGSLRYGQEALWAPHVRVSRATSTQQDIY